ncbi:flagellar hook-associated family protein [Methylocapsa polymorpha]|uniref:Flagellin n=1 Tax=Methylocapsa polymorpha TaxID=3080828 RepID=A0ABZ0HPC2_9HYPH|nr:flagellar hook-associated family protein [Methylocapsa sp. RX1]
MTSYISTQSISSSMRQSVLKMQSELAASQTELSTGDYADIGLSLGAQTGESVSLQAEGSFLKTISDTNSTVSTRLSTTQNVLSSLQSSAQNLLNSLIETNGATSNESTVQTTATGNLQSMLSSLNSSLNGEYIFAGENTGNAPITDYYGASAANKQAVDAAFSAAFGMSQSSAGVSGISGAAIQSFLDNQFASLFQGSNWTSDWSSASSQTLTNQISPTQTENTSVSANAPAFRQLAQAYVMVADLGTQNLSSGAYGAVVSTAEGLLTSAIGNLTSLQENVGVVQTTVTNATDQMSLQMNLLSTQVSDLESVNTYEVATRITDLQTQIETSYSLTSQLQQLSLVKYL